MRIKQVTNHTKKFKKKYQLVGVVLYINDSIKSPKT